MTNAEKIKKAQAIAETFDYSIYRKKEYAKTLYRLFKALDDCPAVFKGALRDAVMNLEFYGEMLDHNYYESVRWYDDELEQNDIIAEMKKIMAILAILDSIEY